MIAGLTQLNVLINYDRHKREWYCASCSIPNLRGITGISAEDVLKKCAASIDEAVLKSGINFISEEPTEA